MSENQSAPHSPLDALLQQWAASRMIDPAKAEEIRREIVVVSGELETGWSEQFNSWLLNVLEQAQTAASAPFQAIASSGYSTGLLDVASPQHKSFQPYYRPAFVTA